jgi:hypothetical protein
MATKPAAKAAPFTIESGTLTIKFPATYVADPRRESFGENDYKTLTKGRDTDKTVAALRQAADVLEANPNVMAVPAGVTPARLREVADLLVADQRAEADYKALGTILVQLRQLNRDVGADITNKLLDMLKAQGRSQPELLDTFSALANLNKR